MAYLYYFLNKKGHVAIFVYGKLITYDMIEGKPDELSLCT